MNPTGDALNAADAANKPLVEGVDFAFSSPTIITAESLAAEVERANMLAHRARHRALNGPSIDEVCGNPIGHFSNFIRKQKTREQLSEENRKLEIQVALDLKMLRATERNSIDENGPFWWGVIFGATLVTICFAIVLLSR